MANGSDSPKQYIINPPKAPSPGYTLQGITGFISVPIIGFILALILFGPTVVVSFMKVLPFVPFHFYVIALVIILLLRWFK